MTKKINVGDIVEYCYSEESKHYYGIILELSDDNLYCWIDWFHLGKEKSKTTYLKVLT
jgi:succinate dehydrogenase flavin-adding protein (antitoxin of CptAB toxin-antitoxin module)